MWQRFVWWLFAPAKEWTLVWMNLIPVLSIVASAGTAIFVMFSSRKFTRDQAHWAARDSVMPCLAFIQQDDGSIDLVNAGKGPAFNVVLRRSLQSVEHGRPKRTLRITAAESLRPVSPIPASGRTKVYSFIEEHEYNLFTAQYSNAFNDRYYKTTFNALKAINSFIGVEAIDYGESEIGREIKDA
jgi:hypothetical protein